jgi:hypothetical protein
MLIFQRLTGNKNYHTLIYKIMFNKILKIYTKRRELLFYVRQ